MVLNSNVQSHMGGICTMEDKKKKFIIPDAEIIEFSNDDIITDSLVDGTDGFMFESEGDGNDL